MLTEASAHLIEAGGKRFRPMLVLLAAQFGDPRDKRVVPAAVAIELTHLATLYHDDVMDEADVRRGTPSANARWDNTVAILTGDFLFARASEILADLGPEAIRIQAETFSRLVTGQIARDRRPARPAQDPFEHYLGVITEKTGSLIATSGRFGAMFSGAPDERGRADRDRLRRRSASPASSPTTSWTWPATRPSPARRPAPTCARASGRCRCSTRCASAGPGDARLIELLGRGELTDPAQHTEALGLLRAHPAMELARADLRRWSERGQGRDPQPARGSGA